MNLSRRILRRLGLAGRVGQRTVDVSKPLAPAVDPSVRGKHIPGRDEILTHLVQSFEFDSVLDIGCGRGAAFPILGSRGADVTGIDLLPEELVNLQAGGSTVEFIRADFRQWMTDRTFDAVVCSHVVEHVADTESFLRKLLACTREGGVYCLIWPPPKPQIVGGHVHVFNVGLMVYNLVRLGVDCRDIAMLRCDYSLGILGRLRWFDLPQLAHDEGDIESLSEYFPFPAHQDFNGDHPSGVIVLSSNRMRR